MEEIINRYKKNRKGIVVLDITIQSYKNLFNKYDLNSSFIKRDLNQDLADYLIESVEDIGSNEFKIQINLPKKEEKLIDETKIERSINGYYSYLIGISKKSIFKIAKRILIHMFIAIILLFTYLILGQKMHNNPSLIESAFIESLAIAMWVLMWPIFSDFIYEILDEQKLIKIYKKIRFAKIEFNYE
jgi:hypothetical protein